MTVTVRAVGAFAWAGAAMLPWNAPFRLLGGYASGMLRGATIFAEVNNRSVIAREEIVAAVAVGDRLGTVMMPLGDEFR